ncbi:MAG TPA: hypothetical protein DEA49_04915 [Petrotoga sp.]|nr:MAG: Uncharacterized protein XD53_1371 [Petrotoga mobilis]HBT51437.1 hypothetical protein [Petrotoga sp.]
MKKILGLVVLMMVMLVSVSGLAQVQDSVDVPVYLNVPAFVRLSVDNSDDGQFDLVFDPANPVNPTDTVKLLAEANVDYTVTSSVAPVSGYEDWAELLQITPNTDNPFNGAPGSTTFNTTATINVIDNLDLGTVPPDTKIADVTFTISASL